VHDVKDIQNLINATEKIIESDTLRLRRKH